MKSVPLALALATGLLVSAMADDPPWTWDTSGHVDAAPDSKVSPELSAFASVNGDVAESPALAEMDSVIYSSLFLGGLNLDASPKGFFTIVR